MSEEASPLLEVVDPGDVTVVRFAGENLFLGGKHLEALTKEVAEVVSNYHPKTLKFDLTDVALLSSEILGLLTSIHSSGVNVELDNLSEDVRDVIKVTNLDKLFGISDA